MKNSATKNPAMKNSATKNSAMKNSAMKDSAVLEDSTVYTVHPNGYKPVSDMALPDLTFMPEREWDTLFAICDALIPAIVPQSKLVDPYKQSAIPDHKFDEIVDETLAALKKPPTRDQLVEYLASRTVDDEGFRIECQHSIAAAAVRMELAKFLATLSSHVGSLLLTGRWTPFPQQPIHVRQKILKSWQTSRLTPLRIVLKSLNALALKSFGAASRYVEQIGGYTTLPKNWEARTGYDFHFMQIPAGVGFHTVETDVVIIGSGCGGGVTAKNLAEAGHRVLVAEKGYYFDPQQLPMSQVAGTKHLFDNAGLIISQNSAISVATGCCWGGGGTINWSVCLKPQDYVRKEWVAAGLPVFESAEFDDCIDRVWTAIGAHHEAIRHNHQNELVLEGSRKLGWHSNYCDQNTGNKEHFCGRCHLGCGSNEKRGPTVAFLPDAAEAGAQFLEGFTAQRVIFAPDGVTALGVEGTWLARSSDGTVHAAESERRQRKVFIKAKKVVLSAGSLWSPTLLIKSGVKVGRNLHLHPAAFLAGEFTEDEPQWEGGIITAYNGEFQNLDRKGHGTKLETMVMVPYAAIAIHPWLSGVESKLLLPRLKQMHNVIAITRDRDPGRITVDPQTGRPQIDYDVSPFDAEHSLDGVEAIAKLMYVMGATALYATIPNVRPFVVARDGDAEKQRNYRDGTDPEFTDVKFANWLKHLREVGVKAGAEPSYLSAHQMGSCRMSAKASDGVVDPKGKVWGHEGLYVADASVFPSASGVNPMVTTLAISEYISRQLVKEMAKER